MLANGITLGYKDVVEGTYTILKGLQEVPEMGEEPEKVEVTTLSDTTKKYEFGIGDVGDLDFTLLYENESETSPYRVLRKAADEKKKLYFEMKYPDGTVFTWEAQVSVKLSGGTVNGAMTFILKMALQSEIDVADPTEP